MYRLLILGSDRWYCLPLARRLLAQARVARPDLRVVCERHGDTARAVTKAAWELGVPVERHGPSFDPGWDRERRSAARDTAADRMIRTFAHLCLVCDPLLAPRTRAFDLARLAVGQGTECRWYSRDDADPLPLADTDSLRPDVHRPGPTSPAKPNFARYWTEVHFPG